MKIGALVMADTPTGDLPYLNNDSEGYVETYTIYFKGIWVAKKHTTGNIYVMTSADNGHTWTTQITVTCDWITDSLNLVAMRNFGGTLYIAIEYKDTTHKTKLYTTPDGINFTLVTTVSTTGANGADWSQYGGLRDIAYFGSRCYAFYREATERQYNIWNLTDGVEVLANQSGVFLGGKVVGSTYYFFTCASDNKTIYTKTFDGAAITAVGTSATDATSYYCEGWSCFYNEYSDVALIGGLNVIQIKSCFTATPVITRLTGWLRVAPETAEDDNTKCIGLLSTPPSDGQSMIFYYQVGNNLQLQHKWGSLSSASDLGLGCASPTINVNGLFLLSLEPITVQLFHFAATTQEINHYDQRTSGSNMTYKQFTAQQYLLTSQHLQGDKITFTEEGGAVPDADEVPTLYGDEEFEDDFSDEAANDAPAGWDWADGV